MGLVYSCPNPVDDPPFVENNAPYTVTADFSSRSFHQGAQSNTFQLLIAEQNGLEDPDGDNITFMSSTLPAWISIDADTGIVTVVTTEVQTAISISFWSEDENGSDTSDTPFSITIDVYNSAPTASFYNYDYLVSNSSTVSVNGEYNFDIKNGNGPRYINGNSVYLFIFINTNNYWGFFTDDGETSLSTIYYYVQYNNSILNPVPPDSGWVVGGGDGAVSVSIGSSIIGTPFDGEAVTGNYIFSDPEDDLEGTSTYQWYICANSTDEGIAITGATEKTYTIPDSSGLNGYLKFEVTPVDENGNAGSAVRSEASYMAFPSGP